MRGTSGASVECQERSESHFLRAKGSNAPSGVKLSASKERRREEWRVHGWRFGPVAKILVGSWMICWLRARCIRVDGIHR